MWGAYLIISWHGSAVGLQQLPNGIAQPAPAQRLGRRRGPSQQLLLHLAHHPGCLGGQTLDALRAVLLLQQLLRLRIPWRSARAAYRWTFNAFGVTGAPDTVQALCASAAMCIGCAAHLSVDLNPASCLPIGAGAVGEDPALPADWPAHSSGVVGDGCTSFEAAWTCLPPAGLPSGVT